ncbi:MAG: NAD(P)-dependent oxidoreductase [Burkholderiaceae bacterium]
MSAIAFLGLGAMGSRMAARLLQSGHAVRVWNRSPQAAEPLAQQGASVATSPRDAVQGAEFVISMLSNDEAARDVWLSPSYGAVAALRAGVVAIESSTVTPAWIRELDAAIKVQGAELVDAPVAGSRPQAQAGQLIYLVGGSAATFERVKPVLSAMGSAIHHVGPRGQGAVLKLAVNSLFGTQVAALGELLGYLKAAGVDAQHAGDILSGMPIMSPAATGALRGMLAQDFAPQFPIDLVEKDFGYALASAEGLGAPLPVVAQVRAQFSAARAKGLGERNISAITRLYA